MGRFGILSRIALIVTAALFLGQMVVLLAFLWQSGRSPLPPYAIADRVVAVVRLLDETLPQARQQVLDVANAQGFGVTYAAGIPADFKDNLSISRLRVVTQAKMEEYAPGRIVRTGTRLGEADSRDAFTITFVVGLKSGEVAIFTISDETTLRIWNVPIGFLGGLSGIVVALLAVLAVARETRPLTELARSIGELGNRVEPVPVKERGARELRTLIRAINNMQTRILALLTNRTLFLGAVSHDLKTYLTRFRLRLEMMPAGPHRDRAVLDVEAMEHLLNDVLLFASESTNTETSEEITDINEALLYCASGLEDVSVDLSTAPKALTVRMPRSALCRVIDNLLSNGVRYGNHVRAYTERRDGVACLVFEDEGPGIAEEDLSIVFEPFFRSEPSRNRGHGGTGLGLSIVKQILDAHGGRVVLSNRDPARGLRAMVFLPLAPTSGRSQTETMSN